VASSAAPRRKKGFTKVDVQWLVPLFGQRQPGFLLSIHFSSWKDIKFCFWKHSVMWIVAKNKLRKSTFLVERNQRFAFGIAA